eukprot:TRINITY_DN4866_c0_g1_i1.p1 TRINITY_DN4866_c0_g1~~TRINITY_DN4866_c0_g1_i1.p1  ORF type:complete len:273 (+),score=62.81 TRINITY_DN4866_c0_g1_i1:36-854(+)
MAEKQVWVSVKDAGVCANRNAKHRRKMEDEHMLVDKFGGVDQQSFFGVYDGHGGQGASAFCKKRLHTAFEDQLKSLSTGDYENTEKMSNVCSQAYKVTDAEMKESVPAAGACVVTAIVRQVGEKRYLYVANAGDSRAVLSRAGKAIRLTKDHKPTDEDEKKRIESVKGFIDKEGRVNGLVGVSRALGDHNMKGPGKDYIINDPYFTMTTLEDDDDYLILACDGVWDVVEDQAAVDLIRSTTEDCNNKAKALIVHAIKTGSQDNVSAIVVQFK